MPKTARIKPDNRVALTDLNDVDQTFADLAKLQRQAQKIEAAYEEKHTAINQQAQAALAPLNKQMERLESFLLSYAEVHPETFAKSKTVKLNFGSLGFRLSVSIETSTKTLALLKKHGLLEAINVKETVKKDVLATYQDSLLKSLQASRKSEDKFWYELKKDAPKTAAPAKKTNRKSAHGR